MPGGRTRARRLPRYEWGPKPRRRTELGLLLFGALITVALYVVASLGTTSKIPDHLGPFLGVILGMALLAHLANRWLVPDANPVLLPLAALLNGIGYVVIVRWSPHFASNQAGWTVIGVVAYVLTLLFIQHSRDLDRYRYLLLLAAVLLLLAPLVPKVGFAVNGAHLWVGRPGSFSFQPVEVAKVLLCIFFASYFAEKKELLSIPTTRVGNRLFLDPRPLLPIALTWGFAMMVIAAEDDVGFAALIFAMFVVMLWVTTGRAAYLVLSLALFAVGAVAAAHFLPQVHLRVEDWLHTWRYQQTGGYQLAQGWYFMGSGGIGGLGLGTTSFLTIHGVAGAAIPEITSDMIFAAIGGELGLLGTSAVVFGFLLLVGAGLRVAQAARSDFARLLAVGLTSIIGFQAFFIMAGVLRLLPFTGIVLPFMAYGGSSLVANYVLIALLMRVSGESERAPDQRLLQPGERAFVAVAS